MPKISKHNIIKISLVITLISLIIITHIELNSLPEEILISQITLFDINKPITIKAFPQKQTILPQGHLIMTLKQDKHTIDAIMFNTNKTIKKEEIKVIGKISTYNKKLQLVIMKMEQLNRKP